MLYKIVLNDTNKLNLLVQVLASGAGTPANYTDIGTFNHVGNDPLEEGDNHVIFQHVRDALYPLGYLDTQIVHITWPGKVVATAITLADQNVDAGSETQLTATTTPGSVSRPRLRWSTADDKIAAITPRGLLVARAPGETTGRVTVIDGGAYKEFAINVFLDYVEPASVTMTPGTAITLTVAAPTAQLTATVLPANTTNKAVVWATSNAAIATVSQSGLVTRVANGTANITATTVDGAKVGTKAITTTA